MADYVANISLGEVKNYCRLAAANDALIIGLMKAAGLETLALKDYDDIAAMLAAANDEADFTNYARKTITSVTITVDDTNDRVDIDIADQVYTVAGGGTNNSVGKAFIAYDPDTTAGTDSSLVPLTYHDFVLTTDGTDVTMQIATAGFFRAA